MFRVIRFVVIVLLAYLAITEGLPWIRERVDGITKDKFTGRDLDTGEPSSNCVFLANQLNAYVNQQAVEASHPPGNPGAWSDSLPTIENRTYEAERACGCPSDACDTARHAVREISELVGDFERLISGDASVAGGLARRQEGIEALLAQARRQAR